MIKLIECPRDAMQGIGSFIPTHLKAAYINLLLKVGFDTIDFGSFVSPKAIPQMRDTAEVLSLLNLNDTETKLLAIVANLKGAENACVFPDIKYLGFPLSVSETFQQRNTNSTIANAINTLAEIQNLCLKHQKQLVVYLSMGFGNPYGDIWNVDILTYYSQKITDLGIQTISLADTIGVSTPEKIKQIYPVLIQDFKTVEWGMHLHSNPSAANDKIAAAFEAGCQRFDSAMKGFGGCPMATDELTGNIATESVIQYLNNHHIAHNVNQSAFNEAFDFASQIF